LLISKQALEDKLSLKSNLAAKNKAAIKADLVRYGQRKPDGVSAVKTSEATEKKISRENPVKLPVEPQQNV
jgi:hypothetical protein